MLDTVEFLARGIAAFRSGDFEQAVFNFKVAVQADRGNARAWLWLAAALDAPEQQRDCLKMALLHDPNSYVAQTLLQRLEQPSASPAVAEAQMHSFECSGCGGHVRFDPERAALVCHYCGLVENLSAPVDRAPVDRELVDREPIDRAPGGPTQKPRPASRQAANGLDTGAWALTAGQFTCEKCGASVWTPAKALAAECPFCGSVKVLAQPLTPGLIQPHSLIPFCLDSEAAVRGAIQPWLGKIRLAPDMLAEQVDAHQVQLDVRAIYLPFWNYTGQVQVSIGGRWEPKPLNDFARVVKADQRTWYEQDIDHCLIYASKSIPGALLEKAMPFDLSARVVFQAQHLAGWQAETYQVAPADASSLAKKRMRDAAVRNAQRAMLLFHPERLLQSDVRTRRINGELILLPVWTGRYTYQGRSFPILINGQTGEVAGEKPADAITWWWVGGILAVLMVILLALLGLWWLAG